jgi:hypothetical protein
MNYIINAEVVHHVHDFHLREVLHDFLVLLDLHVHDLSQILKQQDNK